MGKNLESCSFLTKKLNTITRLHWHCALILNCITYFIYRYWITNLKVISVVYLFKQNYILFLLMKMVHISQFKEQKISYAFIDK